MNILDNIDMDCYIDLYDGNELSCDKCGADIEKCWCRVLKDIVKHYKNKEKSIFFENIVRNNQPEGGFSDDIGHPRLMRQYRYICISRKDYEKVFNNPGKFASVDVSGAGFSNWYFYHTMTGSKVLIIETFWNDRSCWSWQDRGIDEEDVY